MQDKLLQEIDTYLYYIKCTTHKDYYLLGYDELDEIDELMYYPNLYEGGNYIYDEENNKMYYYYFRQKEVN